MSQTRVTNFYSTRKRFKEPKKSLKNVELLDLSKPVLKDTESTVVVAPRKVQASSSKARGKKVNKVTDYLKPLTNATKPATNETTETKQTEAVNEDSQIKKTETVNEDSQIKKTEEPRTPKRNLSNPEELTPTKKKVLQETASVSKSSPAKQIESPVALTPKKSDPNVRRKLQLGSSPNRFMSPRKVSSPQKLGVSPQKAATYENISQKDLASLLNESRSKMLFSDDKLDDLKKSLEKFSRVSANTKEFQSNPYKITSVISSAKPSDGETKPIQRQQERSKYGYLAVPESSSLILPVKYKVLGEAFRCLDTVVSMLNNRKEKITFDKLQNGVQKMMNKNFLLSHFAQIMTVFPGAYSLQYEKNDSYIINKNCSHYQLVITPKLFNLIGNSTLTEESSSKSKKNNKTSFILMTPQHLLERKKIFLHNLTNITKRHHQDFLIRINFPSVGNNAIVRWHPKFNVEGVPDIPTAALPEEPESKVFTAKDVLKKFKGSVKGRVEKALQSVADEHKTETNEKSSTKADAINSPVNKKQSSALKGICTDLLEKIRARESAKLIENMTRSVEDEKRSAMLERLPKIVNILWHYFIAERKTAVPVDVAVEKIIHSFNSLTTPENVKAHLQLITETMPGWLTFIKIPKGEYITMDKKRDINEMIANIK